MEAASDHGEVVIARADVAQVDVDDYRPEDEALQFARANAGELGDTVPLRPSTGAMLQFLATAVGARAVVEIGTGCGTSGIWLLRGMRPDSMLTSVDLEPEHQRLAKEAFSRAGFAANRYRLILGRALDVLPRLSDGAYDMVFCDADVREYPDYLGEALRLLRVGGVVAFDDAFLPADDLDEVAVPPTIGPLSSPDPALSQTMIPPDPDVEAMRELVELIGRDDRLVPAFLPVGEGLLAAVKRS